MPVYLESFRLPTPAQEYGLLDARMAHNGGAFGYVDNVYPCGLFRERGLSELTFRPITILYGCNGSGKSTLLNLIAETLQLNRIAPFNSGEMFACYAAACRYTLGYDDEGFRHRIPNGSRIITSDDIFDYMLHARMRNEQVGVDTGAARDEWAALRFGGTVPMRGLQDHEMLRRQVMARKSSRRQFARRIAGQETRLCSNGETAMNYFNDRLHNNTLYCLDEPENSMAPAMQLELAALIAQLAHYCGCQFIIATHSPFLLALENAWVYDLDAAPVALRNWWELPNVKTTFDFFEAHRSHFIPS